MAQSKTPGISPASPIICVFFGVCGSGKTRIGPGTAKTIDAMFLDADDFHPPENRAKMAAGIALEDADRYQWLELLREAVDRSSKQFLTVILACSALREAYRQQLCAESESCWLWFLLHGSGPQIRQRLEQRKGHFMPAVLLESQLATLEIPSYAETLDISRPVHALVEEAAARILSVQGRHAKR